MKLSLSDFVINWITNLIIADIHIVIYIIIYIICTDNQGRMLSALALRFFFFKMPGIQVQQLSTLLPKAQHTIDEFSNY